MERSGSGRSTSDPHTPMSCGHMDIDGARSECADRQALPWNHALLLPRGVPDVQWAPRQGGERRGGARGAAARRPARGGGTVVTRKQ